MKLLTHPYSVWTLVLVIVVMLVVALPASAAPGGTLVSYQLNAANCYVNVTAQVQDAGFYAINFWDDGNFRAGAGGDIPAGGTFTVRLTIGGVILQGAAGIGVYLANAVGPAATTTYDSNGSAQLWSDAVGLACSEDHTFAAQFLGVAGSNDACTYLLPAGSVVYNVPDGALAYYAADPNTYTGFNLPPGTWYISEFGDAFAKVWIACQGQPVYIPVGNVVR